MQGKGVDGKAVRIDWPELMRFKRSFTEPVPKQREESFVKAGIVTFHGRARFIGPAVIRVDDAVLEAKYVAVATGARPASLKIPGEDLLTTSDRFLELDILPRRILFVGGGYISFEFAHVAARAGALATILHRGSRPLAGFDPDLVDLLMQRTRELGIDVQLETAVEGIDKTSDGLAVHARTVTEQRTFKTEMVVHGAGRVPEIDDLDLNAAGVEWDARKGVKINGYLQSVSNPAVYAAGDAAASGGLPLTPVAGYEGRIVADNLLSGNCVMPNYAGIPTVMFTIPNLAAVGLRKQQLKIKV